VSDFVNPTTGTVWAKCALCDGWFPNPKRGQTAHKKCTKREASR